MPGFPILGRGNDERGRWGLPVYRGRRFQAGVKFQFRRLVDGEPVRTVDGRPDELASGGRGRDP